MAPRTANATSPGRILTKSASRLAWAVPTPTPSNHAPTAWPVSGVSIQGQDEGPLPRSEDLEEDARHVPGAEERSRHARLDRPREVPRGVVGEDEQLEPGEGDQCRGHVQEAAEPGGERADHGGLRGSRPL